MLSRSGARHVVPRAILLLAPECGAILCLLTLLWWGVAATLQHQRTNALQDAARDTGNLAQAFDENTERILAGADQILLALRSQYVRSGTGFDLAAWMARESSPDWLTAQIAIIGADGMSVASTASTHRVSVADREHFLSQRSSDADALLISKPVVGRSSGRWTFQLTRKIVLQDGKFGGIVVLSVDCYDLSAFYQSLHLRQGYITLAGLDGLIRARGPVIPGVIGTTMTAAGFPAALLDKPAGTLRTRAGANDWLTVSYQRLRAYPLVILVAFSDKQVLASYRHMRVELLLCASIATTIVLALGAVWIGQRRRSLASQEALSVTLENMIQGLVMVDENDRVRVANRRALDFLGLPVRLMSSLRRAASRERNEAEQAILQAIQQHAHPGGDAPERLLDHAGTVIETATSMIPGRGMVHVMTDVTARHIADARIRHLAMHDHLTGLGNRVSFAEEVDRLIEISRASGEPFALLLLDLDRFKLVNDTFGHDAGDALLIEVARRLTETVANRASVARNGGDEFAALSCIGQQPGASSELAAAITSRLGEPFHIAGQDMQVSACVGMALYPEDAASRADLMQYADLALYAAKADRNTRVRRFKPVMADAVQDKFRLIEDLRTAVGTPELYLKYQPQFRTSSLEVVGFEALVRWEHPLRGNIPPDVFIPLAEETGLIIPLCRQIFEQACQCAMTWPDGIRLAVNLSPVQVRDPNLPKIVSDLLAAAGLWPSRLELEVTEGVLIADERQAFETLAALRSLGIGLALDDFGTGYASLSYLRKFPFERIKLDRSFVQAQVNDPRARHILESILSLGRNLGLGTIAEGVETKTQLRLLRQQRCQEIQGFLVGKPMLGAETLRLLPPADANGASPASAAARALVLSRSG